MKKSKLSPTPPGEMLLEEFLKPMNISQYKLAKDIGVQQTRISQIIKGTRAITPDTALRLGRYFRMSAEFWMNLQIGYELRITRERFGKIIDEEVHPLDSAA
jgi:antitoxin HigA-1